ncbi:hypothetical protein F1640_14790 [Novosphingobium sp. NBM11]|uniref:hypothetical protein n=1 Tax=Novosphingobium sp. NBM11 TaxID=2596914 RepID=UPI0018928587|nr:hypothetical protein [Novosphingobium sp. NBM11]MBF5091257.1 hypothetical protein [Novosphingobium sp. NBM11]
MTETPHTPLENCPFCGWSRNESYADAPCGDRRYWTVICDQCEAHGPPFSECGGGEKEAIAAWNTRATPLPTTANNPETDAHRDLVEALNAVLDTCGARGTYHAFKYGDAIERAESLLASLTKAEVTHG